VLSLYEKRERKKKKKAKHQIDPNQPEAAFEE
jgi:hypothetical protein